jgi:hypothetical protein
VARLADVDRELFRIQYRALIPVIVHSQAIVFLNLRR